MRYLNVVLAALILSSPVFAEFCPRIFTKLSARGADATRFWNRTTAYKAGDGSGAKMFKFGFDAELWSNSDSLAIIAQHKPTWKKLAHELEAHGPYYSLSQLSHMLDMSEGQVSRAMYAGGRAKEDGEYVLTDLKPSALAHWEHGSVEKNQYAPILAKFVNASLKAQGIPVSAKLETDSGNRHEQAVELVMDGAISKPVEFKKLVDWLYKTVDSPETHFHVSIPTNHIEPEQMMLAARALETKILLDQIVRADRDFHDTYAPHDNTSFSINMNGVRSSGNPQVERGIVRVESFRWSGPEAHDVEIRDWIDKKHAMESMHFMMELARNAHRLRGSDDFRARELRNTMPPNLNGGLRYAAYMLEDRLPASKQYIVADLKNLAAELERSGSISEAAREKVADYLRDNNVLKHLTLETFLEPEE